MFRGERELKQDSQLAAIERAGSLLQGRIAGLEGAVWCGKSVRDMVVGLFGTVILVI
jgi:hypothetical protein